MSDWVEQEASPPRVAEWLHATTGVELFVREDGEGYGVHVRALPDADVDRVSIGDPETGLFRTFDVREEAVEWTDDWKDELEDLDALLPGDATGTGGEPTGDTDDRR